MKIKSLEEKLIELESVGLFDENLSLYLLDTPTKEDLQKSINIVASENDFFVFAKGYSDSIKVGTTFEAIISRKFTSQSIYHKSILKYVSVRKGDKIDYLPRGYSGICLLEFPDSIPKIIKNLPSRADKKDEETYDSLVISQKNALDRILY